MSGDIFKNDEKTQSQRVKKGPQTAQFDTKTRRDTVPILPEGEEAEHRYSLSGQIFDRIPVCEYLANRDMTRLIKSKDQYAMSELTDHIQVHMCKQCKINP